MDAAIVIEGLTKRYGRAGSPFPLPFLGDRLYRHDQGRSGAADDEDDLEDEDEDEELGDRGRGWALRDVSFVVPRGEAVGIVGAVGAGKSTLVKVLGRVTPPTEGRATINGRVAPLLDVAARLRRGDKRVRDNCVLIAEFLGISRSEARERVPAILDFAELQDAGGERLRVLPRAMQDRLALATALNIDADVFLADGRIGSSEAAFNRRCEHRLRDLIAGGAALVFAADRPALVRRSCSLAVWLHEGRVRQFGPVDEVVDAFETSQLEGGDEASARSRAPLPIRLRELEVVCGDDGRFKAGDQMEFIVSVTTSEPGLAVSATLALLAERGGQYRFVVPVPALAARSGEMEFTVRLATAALAPGRYTARATVVGTRVDGSVVRASSSPQDVDFELVGGGDQPASWEEPTAVWQAQSQL